MATQFSLPQDAEPGRRNIALLLQLRWVAIGGQLVTIALVHWGMGIPLPIASLLPVPALLVILNLVSWPLLRRRLDVSETEITVALLIDVAALAWQLHLTGGHANPFASLFLLQVVLGAMLLTAKSSLLILAAACLGLAAAAADPVPLALPERYSSDPFRLYLQGSLVCFGLIALLIVGLVTRANRILRDRDAALANIRQRAIEEDHIVRLGLLASGAAHELGTPLSSISVLLSDWQRMKQVTEDPDLAEDVKDMRTAVERCKAIVGRILQSAGEARGEAPRPTTLRTFLNEIIAEWRASRLPGAIEFVDLVGADLPIVSDPVLKQVIGNVIDNAAEVSPTWIGITARREQESFTLEIMDRGPGFAPDILEGFGQPYRSTKGRPGGGLGLFLLVNVIRKLGGTVTAENMAQGGARVWLTLPLASIRLGADGPS